VARLELQLRGALPGSAASAGRELWVAGTLSELARQAAHALGWQLHELPDQSQ